METRQRILEVALRLFSTQGYAATSTRQLAKEAGVSEGLIFHHFGTKDELLFSILKTKHTLAAEVRKILYDYRDRRALDCLRAIAFCVRTLVYAETNPVCMLMFESQTNEVLHGKFQNIMEETAGLFSQFLKNKIAAGELRKEVSTKSMALGFMGSLIQFFILHKHLPEDEWLVKTDRYIRDILEIWYRGAAR